MSDNERKWRSAEQRHFDVCKAFNEIMTSGNPLTQDEIRVMVQNRPALFGFLKVWLDKDEE